ncbi:MAG: amino acid ABC transporter permease [Oligoflexales bacterium]
MKKDVKEIFFSKSSLFSLLIGAFLLYLMFPVIQWTFIDANWLGDSSADCQKEGACWVFIFQQLGTFVFGFYPVQHRWRIFLVVMFWLLGFFGLRFIKKSSRLFFLVALCLVLPILSWQVLVGFLGMTKVETSQWGGVFLTLLVSFTGIIVSMPLGIVLALGRQSKLPILSLSSTIFIEFWRGIPLITVLFMSSVMLPIFLPERFIVDKLLRALFAVALFSSAYMAEVIRGGLQAIPRGQYEAGYALGLSYGKNMAFVVIPQAIKHVIPGIVNSFIALFKDTTLVSIIGMFDVLGVVQAATTHPDWLGYSIEGYLFAGIFYWFCCYSMSKYSISIERKLSKGY